MKIWKCDGNKHDGREFETKKKMKKKVGGSLISLIALKCCKKVLPFSLDSFSGLFDAAIYNERSYY
jgi:hypothetical protein